MVAIDHNNSVSLQEFSTHILGQNRQASILANLVKRNGWLADTYYGGAFDRYSSGRLRAIRNIGRIANHPSIYPFIIYNHPQNTLSRGCDENPVGVATVVPGLEVTIPAKAGQRLVADADYWLDEDSVVADSSLHTKVAEALIVRASRIESEHQNGNRFVSVIGTIEPDKAHQPEGFQSPEGVIVSETGRLLVSGSDTFDITKGGRQLIVCSLFVTLET